LRPSVIACAAGLRRDVRKGSGRSAWTALLENRANVTRSAAQATTQLLWTAAVLAQVAIVLLLARRVWWLPYALAILVIADLAAPAGRAIQRFHPNSTRRPRGETDRIAAPDDRVLTIDGRHANLRRSWR
jgi:hypothetical protein